jgi:lauroyl/myristoyl acyltransferase
MDANLRYRKFFDLVQPREFGDRIIRADEADSIPDNSPDYESVEYIYEGLDGVKSLLADGKPVAFVMWHHGARQHADYAVVRVLPQTVIFTRKTFQYGKVFSYPMIKGQALSLFRMERLLRDGRPILYYLDGVPIGDTVQLPILGVPSNLSTAPIHNICSVEGVRIIPVTNYYRDGNRVEVIFHPPLPAVEQLSGMTAREVLAVLLRFFEQDQRVRAPEQVMWWFIAYRMQQAEQIKAERSTDR